MSKVKLEDMTKDTLKAMAFDLIVRKEELQKQIQGSKANQELIKANEELGVVLNMIRSKNES